MNSKTNQATAPKRAAIYARVAAQSQAGQASDALELQVNGCKGYCQERGYTIEHVYQEAFSGVKLDRPMLDKLRQAAREKQFDVLIIWDFSRLARRMALQAVIMRELCEAGITIQSVCDGKVEGEDIARFITMAHEYMAEVESERRKIRARSRKTATSQQEAQQQ